VHLYQGTEGAGGLRDKSPADLRPIFWWCHTSLPTNTFPGNAPVYGWYSSELDWEVFITWLLESPTPVFALPWRVPDPIWPCKSTSPCC